jgi:hypothetical protein
MAASPSPSEPPIGVDHASKAGRSKACNECKQQKVVLYSNIAPNSPFSRLINLIAFAAAAM